jgi:hypothetical protein
MKDPRFKMPEDFSSVMPDSVVSSITLDSVGSERQRALTVLLFLHYSRHVAVHIFKPAGFIDELGVEFLDLLYKNDQSNIFNYR